MIELLDWYVKYPWHGTFLVLVFAWVVVESLSQIARLWSKR